MLTTNAPRKTPGQRRYPPRRRATSAMPVGGQTRVANPDMVPSCRPMRAARKYNTAIAPTVPSCFARRGRSGLESPESVPEVMNPPHTLLHLKATLICCAAHHLDSLCTHLTYCID